MTIPKDALHNETTIKQFLPFLKRIELWNYKFVPEILLLDGKFEKLWHAIIKANQFFSSPKNGKFEFT